MSKSRHAFFRVLSFLGSLQLAVALLVLIATVLAVTSFLEAIHGSAYVRWFVYEQPWFCGLWAVLAVNIACGAVRRFSLQRPPIGLLFTHAGLLVLLLGMLISFLQGKQGVLELAEDQEAGEFVVPAVSQITASWVGKPDERPFKFAFDGGPVDWTAGHELEVGEVDGVGARIVRYLRHASLRHDWAPDSARAGGPYLTFKVLGPDGKKVASHWLSAGRYGNALMVGPLRIQLEQATSDAMLENFRDVEEKSLAEQGSLTIYYQDMVKQVSVHEFLEKRIALDDSGVTIEIVQYLPNARPSQAGSFVTKGEQPGNPMVELQVHMPGEVTPFRQIAFAKDPLLNLDGVYPRDCPVKFRYEHPALDAGTSVELLRALNGELLARTCQNGKRTFHGQVQAGGRIEVSNNFQVEIEEFFPFAKEKVSFQPAFGKRVKNSEPAVLVELRVAGTTHELWLQRNVPLRSHGTIETSDGSLSLSYGNGTEPLGFNLKLTDFDRRQGLDGAGDAEYASRLQLVGRDGKPLDDAEIGTNRPLRHEHFTICQAGVGESRHNAQASRFTVTFDPGRPLKQAGCVMIFCGIAVMFVRRSIAGGKDANARVRARIEAAGISTATEEWKHPDETWSKSREAA
ncbi:MAG: hypothetical protein KDA42_00060 [Planctomycetales bacterium]|nr:hypothetical protein [Planctomycetales bacterium]